MLDHGIDEYQQSLPRTCEECGYRYTVKDYLETQGHYFPHPYDYRAGCETHCLACWLGVGPKDILGEDDGCQDSTVSLIASDEDTTSQDCQVVELDEWPYKAVYESLMEGDVLPAFKWFLDMGAHLAVLPVARLHVDHTTVFPGAVAFYPPSVAYLDQLNLIPNRVDTNSLAEQCSAASGITLDVLQKHSLVVFPCRFDWQTFRRNSHRGHLELIRSLSEAVERACLNFVRYRSCRLERIDDLPAHPGQVMSNHMMAGALLYNGALHEARVIGGAAFTHYLTRGLGLPLEQFEWDSFPQDGETGQIVQHALSLYASLLESENLTARFMQALGLLEFLAYPDEYQKFEKVSKVIARYVTREPTEYQRLMERFFELTGKKDPNTGRIIGYRTRVVHMGERIEQLVPDSAARKQLFVELDEYIKPVIDHMIAHSEKTFEDYLEVRGTLRPFEKGGAESEVPF